VKKTSKRTVVSRKYGFSNFVLDPTIVYWSQSITFCDRVSESERCFSGNGESGKSNSRDHTLLPNLVSRFRYSDRKNVHLLERAFLQFRKLATKKRKKLRFRFEPRIVSLVSPSFRLLRSVRGLHRKKLESKE